MTFLQAVFLGILQGFTEFLPISSSGHLVLAEELLAIPLSARNLLGFDVMLHAGSLLALLLVYGKRYLSMCRAVFGGDRAERRLLLMLIIATIPAALAGYFLEEVIAEQFRSMEAIALGLSLSAAVLLMTEALPARSVLTSIRPLHAVMIGLAQTFALFPSLSRSGMTISAGRAMGLSPKDALNFSFLMAVPVIAGAVLLTSMEVWQGDITLPPAPIVTAGFLTSFAASLVAILLLQKWVRHWKLSWFAVYLLPLSAVLLLRDFPIERFGDPAFVTATVKQYGAIVVFLFALIESVPPLSFFSPGVLALIVAGALIGDVEMAAFFFCAAIAGSATGNTFFYMIGQLYGRRIAHRFYLSEHRLRAVDAFMRRFGSLSVFLGQFVGGVRPFSAFVAGTVAMPKHTYFLFMLGGTIVWASLLLGLGFLLRDQMEWVLSIVGTGGLLLFLLCIGIIWILERRMKKQQRRELSVQYP
ncbi:MAG: undecaprenyl-diphosphate phosphatase [Candidatus Peregrinibacteria bacterium]|nr:undecaprenyl-diphosphate phosphatase [Candidatus Peregrinibacteria bacterium]